MRTATIGNRGHRFQQHAAQVFLPAGQDKYACCGGSVRAVAERVAQRLQLRNLGLIEKDRSSVREGDYAAAVGAHRTALPSEPP